MKKYLPKSPPKILVISATVFLSALALLIYANTFNAPFVFDDLPNIAENPLFRMTEITPEAMTRILKSQGVRPMANFSFAVNYFFHGYDVRGYHAVNLVIHIITSLLIWLVSRQTLRLCHSENTRIPFFAAALWLVNPVHTQSVTYIVQRMNSMAAMFFMLALFCYIRARMKTMAGQGGLQGFFYYAFCLIAAILGLLSKQIVAILPAILLLYEWFFFQNLNRARLKKQLPWISLAVLAILFPAFLYMGGSPLDKFRSVYAGQEFTMDRRLLTEANVVIYYISLLFFPHPARLNLDYDFPLSQSPTDPVSTALAMAALALLIIAAGYSAKKHRLPAFAALWFLVTLVIESSFIGLALVYEHRTYLPSVFPVIGIAWLVFSHVRPKPLAIAVMCAAIGVCGVWTYQRNKVWSDATAFWQDTVAKSPEKSRPYTNLGAVLLEREDIVTATSLCLKAIRLDPENADAYTLIGMINLRQNRPDKAVPFFQKALLLKPKELKHLHNLGVALDENGQTEQALQLFTDIIDQYPYAPKAFYHLARIHARRNDLDTAATLYRKAIIYQPDYANAFNDLGLVLMMQKKPYQAIAALEKAAAIDPDHMSAHLNLAQILQRKTPRQALAHATRAGMLEPHDPRPHILAGDILASLGDIDQAVSYYEKASTLQPENPKLFYNLACLYARQNKKQMAVANLKKAVNRGYTRWDHLKADKDLENIHDTEYYQNLIRLGSM